MAGTSRLLGREFTQSLTNLPSLLPTRQNIPAQTSTPPLLPSTIPSIPLYHLSFIPFARANPGLLRAPRRTVQNVRIHWVGFKLHPLALNRPRICRRGSHPDCFTVPESLSFLGVIFGMLSLCKIEHALVPLADNPRYVGTLHEINSETSTVALENVISFGTEGRKGNPDEEIPASDSVYEYIVFRGSDVKDLRIEEAPVAKENKPPQVPNDPAILGVRQKCISLPDDSNMTSFFV
jgi:hypothetical protein